MAPLSSYIKRSFNVIHSSLYKSQYLDFVANGYLIKERRKCLIKYFNKLGSALLAACVLFTSVPVNALSAGETYTEQQTLDDLNTENKISTEESNATSAEVATDSNVTEDISISDISSNDIDSSEEKLNNEISLQNDNTEDDEETSTDNWELGLVFYDSTVDNGKTPLTEINWDASDGGAGMGEPRVITVQINYKNTNAITTYEPGDLKIKISNIMFDLRGSLGSNGRADCRLKWSAVVGANDYAHTGYDWDYTTCYYKEDGSIGQSFNSLSYYSDDIIFTNANTIEEKSDFEGSIQIVYTLTPFLEVGRYSATGSSYSTYQPERYEDECTHSLNMDLQAEIEGIAKSNKVVFDYTRTYIHPWEKPPASITKSAGKISSYDGLGENASDYIWVEYSFRLGSVTDEYPQIGMDHSTALVYDVFPKECVLYKTNGERLTPADENGLYILDNTCMGGSIGNNRIVYAGYPKSVFNEGNGNLIITNTADYYGYYKDDLTKLEYLDTSSVTINLAEFDFIYSGDLYRVDKTTSYPATKDYVSMRYQDIINGWSRNSSSWYLYPTAIYTGTPMTVRVGDDLLYATDKNNNYVKLNDDEYFFSSVQRINLKNGNGNSIPSGKYDCELFVRYADETEYVSFEKFKNGYGGDKSSYYPQGRGAWSFSEEDKIVGWYINIYDMTESLVPTSVSSTNGAAYSTYVCLKKKDISETGTLYNFDYIQVYFKDKDGNYILQNTVGEDSYNTPITKKEIANYDLETYGHYMQRDCAYQLWEYYSVKKDKNYLYSPKSFNGVTQDVANEQFLGSFNIGGLVKLSEAFGDSIGYNYIEQYDENDAINGFIFYDLLPAGMELLSNEEEIQKSIVAVYSRDTDRISSSLGPNSSVNSDFLLYKLDGTKVSVSELIEIVKNQSAVKITKNWNNTGRTKVEVKVDFSDSPIIFGTSSFKYYIGAMVSCRYAISYDSFLEYGNVWTNYCYGKSLGGNLSEGMSISDNGHYDKDASDINENGDTTEKISYQKATTTITSVISTHQDVTKYVQTDKSNYSTGTVKASPDSEYTYKLRARTGSANVTNLVIYDSIEEYVQDPYSAEQNFITAYGTKKHWNGEFLGVDTSYAENKGYKVKVYYSENAKAGNLSDDDSWKEYSDSVDKSKVKSLAFEYLNKDDESQKAVLPANSQTYVLVKMKAPPEENRKILSYNGCRTQWQALDDYDRPVDFITGINSNIVKVSLSDYYDLTVNKTWEDENNKWGFRPESIDIILKKDGKEVERKQITKDNLSVTFTDLLIEDSDRYTIEEAPLLLYSSSIEYNELEDCYEITNTLRNDIFTDISGTKTWVGDTESKRPESITIKLLKDGNVYRTTTTNADKEWKYSFDKVPIYNADETRCIYSVEEIPIEKYTTQYTNGNGTDNRNGLAIKFNSQCRTESANYDYVEIYYKQDGQSFKLGKWGGTDLAGKTVNVPTNDFYLYWRTDSSQCSYYGFSIDSIESAEVSATGTVATLPNYTATELTGTDYPESPNHGNYGNNLNMLWHYTGTLSSDVPAEGLFNIVNTYEGVDSVNISFIKGIEGTDEAFEKLQLKRDDLYKFQVSMKNRETGDTISVQIDNKNTVTVREIPIGTYTITEKDDMYFDFVSMESLNSVEGITFEKVGNDYVLTITKDAAEEETLQIKVNNKIEPDRPYEDKEEKENLFKYSSNEEKASLLSKIANFFTN